MARPADVVSHGTFSPVVKTASSNRKALRIAAAGAAIVLALTAVSPTAWLVHESTPPRARVPSAAAAHMYVCPPPQKADVSLWLRVDCGTCGHRHGRARRARSFYQRHRSKHRGAGEAGEDAHGERGHAGAVLPQVWRPALNSGARSYRGAANMLRWRARVRQRREPSCAQQSKE